MIIIKGCVTHPHSVLDKGINRKRKYEIKRVEKRRQRLGNKTKDNKK